MIKFIFLIFGFLIIGLAGCINKDVKNIGVMDAVESDKKLNFETFISEFLETCFFDQQFDSLVYAGSPLVKQFIHDEIGFLRYYKPGAICFSRGYREEELINGYLLRSYPRVDFVFYPGKMPRYGLCMQSPDPDGIYYKRLEKLPPDFDFDDFVPKAPQLPEKYSNAPLMGLTIIENTASIKQLYFIYADNRWWLVIIDDCDCSA